MEKPSTRIHTTPNMACEVIVITKIRGIILFGEGNSSAKCVGPSRAMSVAILLYNPRKTLREPDEYLRIVSILCKEDVFWISYPVSLLMVLKRLSGVAFGATTSNATVNAINPRAVERPIRESVKG